MKVLAVGDIVGTAGINKLKQSLKQITQKEKFSRRNGNNRKKL